MVEKNVLLFDGVCNLCNASVQWVLLRDRKEIFRFAALQSETARALLSAHALSPDSFDSVVLVTPEKVYTHSDAALEVLRRLGGWWAIPAALRILPKQLRDAVYKWIAANRYRWFGRRESCMLPKAEWKARFL